MELNAVNTHVLNNASYGPARTQDKNARLALNFARSLAVVVLIGAVGALTLWLLTGERYPQLLAYMGLLALTAVGLGIQRLLISMNHAGDGARLMLTIVVIAIGLLPAIAPDLLPTVAAGMILVAITGQGLFGNRWGAAFGIGCAVLMVFDSWLIQSPASSLFSGVISRDFAQSGIVPVGNVFAVSAFILIGRQLLNGFTNALAEQSGMLRTLIDSLPDSVFVKDSKGRIIVNNVAHARNLQNSTPEQVIGKSDFDFFPRELAQKYHDDEQQIIKSGQAKLNFEEPTLDPQGHQHWLLTTKVPFHDAAGQAIGIVGINRDITSQRETELERDRLLRVEQEQRTGLESLMLQVRNTIGMLGSATTEVHAASSQQASSIAEQESTITQTMSTVEEVRVAVSQTADKAQLVADSARQSVSVVRSGQQSVNDAVDAMRIIRQRVESIAQTIAMLSERVQQISEINTTVTAIADQSKLLALNASIEAARAGKEGRGFGVVALQVRELASQSRDATLRVRTILTEINQATDSVTVATKEGTKGSETGLVLVERAGQVIQELASTIEDAAQTAIQIAVSTHQQTSGMDHLSQTIRQIREAASQTTMSVRQTEQSMKGLEALAQQLELTVERFEN